MRGAPEPVPSQFMNLIAHLVGLHSEGFSMMTVIAYTVLAILVINSARIEVIDRLGLPAPLAEIFLWTGSCSLSHFSPGWDMPPSGELLNIFLL